MGKQWFVVRGNRKLGPFTTSRLKELAAGENIKPTDLIHSDAMEPAKPASQIAGLLSLDLKQA